MTHLRSHCHTKLGVFGTGCRPVPLEDGKKLSKDIPTAKLVIIEDSGHNIQEEQPKDVARLINGFLGDVWGWNASERDTRDM
jgi:pimeloyl-ACP methyl ester carboxylesterase